MQWHDYLEHLAAVLKEKDLIDDTQIRTWKNNEEAAEKLGIPAPFVQALWNSGYVSYFFFAREVAWCG
jgi:hypothetical protein